MCTLPLISSAISCITTQPQGTLSELNSQSVDRGPSACGEGVNPRRLRRPKADLHIGQAYLCVFDEHSTHYLTRLASVQFIDGSECPGGRAVGGQAA